MYLKIVGYEKDFAISPDTVRGWMAPAKNFGDNQHNLFRAALRFSGAPRSHDSSVVQHSGHLNIEDDQRSQLTEQLKKVWAAGRNMVQRWREQGSAAASISDSQPLAETHGRAEGTASASSGG